MKKLYELARLSESYDIIIEALIKREKENFLMKLFSLLKSNEQLDNNTAMVQIYGRKDLPAFSRLKASMKEILIKAFSLQSNKHESAESRNNESFNQFRHVLVSKLLRDLKANELSVEIAEKALLKSTKYNLTEIVLILVRFLIRHFGTSEYNKYKLKKYFSIQEKYLRIHEWEVKSENYFIDLQNAQLHSLATPNENTKLKSRKYVKELETVKDIHTYTFYSNKYKVEAAYFEYIKDYESLLKLSDKTIKLFSNPEFQSNVSLQNINLRKAWALIQAGRNDDAIAIGRKDMRIILPGSMGWYFIAHYTLKAYLYNGDYKNAIELISNIIDNNRFKRIGQNYQELFNTTLGYINLIVKSHYFEELINYSSSLPEFKLYKFLNTVPVFSKDKRGINVSILLMHVAYLLQRKDYDGIIDRIDSLNQYAFRYLRKDDTFRSNCMIKMVIQMAKADFNPIRTERYTQDLLKQLEQVKLAGSGENIETEIIPYEVLWKIMVKAL